MLNHPNSETSFSFVSDQNGNTIAFYDKFHELQDKIEENAKML